MADFDAQRKARLEAMADKKRRLEELKKMRQDKQSDAAAVAPVVSSMEQLSVKDNRRAADVENILSSILTTENTKGADAEAAPATSTVPVVDAAALLEEKRNALETCKPLVHFSAAPVSVESYDKETQTDSCVGDNAPGGDVEAEEAPVKATRSSSSAAGRKNSSPVKKRTSSESAPHDDDTIGLAAATPATTSQQAPANAANAALVVSAALTTNNAEFSAFLKKTSKFAERALAQSATFDICVDYRSAGSSGAQTDAGSSSMGVAPQWSADSDVLRNRPVLAIFNNMFYNELYVVSYGARLARQKGAGVNIHESGDPSGVLAVWSTVTPGSPELLCYSSASHVLAVKFNPTNPKQIIGGCYNGQIVLWDMSASSGNSTGGASEMLLPVQRSSLSGKGCHRYAIVGFTVVGTALGGATDSGDAENTMAELVSVSADGLICHWDLGSLIEPTRSYYYNGVSSASASGDAPSSLSCLCFATSAKPQEQAYGLGGGEAIVGTEQGKLFQINCPAPKTLSVISKFTQVDAHFGIVTQMHMHPSNGPSHRNSGKFSAMNQLLLTIALDWRIKLWDSSVLARPSIGTAAVSKARTGATGAASTPNGGLLFEFVNPSYDYVSDVQWSPVHPAVFACITSNNTLYVWNILASSTEPADSVSIPHVDGATGTTGAAAVACTQLEWGAGGRQIYVGNSAGTVFTVALKDSVATHSPADDAKFEALISQKRKSSNA